MNNSVTNIVVVIVINNSVIIIKHQCLGCIRMDVFAMCNLQAARNGIPIFPWMLLMRTIWPVLLEIMLGRMAAKRENKKEPHK